MRSGRSQRNGTVGLWSRDSDRATDVLESVRLGLAQAQLHGEQGERQSILNAELVEVTRQVPLDRLLNDRQPRPDLPILAPPPNQRDDVPSARSQEPNALRKIRRGRVS